MSGRTLHLLVVDDDSLVCAAIGDLLRDEGHTVVQSYTALDAVALLAGSVFDVALIDYQLGGNSTMSGVNVARHGPRSLIRVAMTGYDADLVRRGHEGVWPFDRILRKPILLEDIQELIAWVRGMLADTQP